MRKIVAYEGLPVECSEIEDPEKVAALLGTIGETLKRLGLKKVLVGEDGVVVGEG